LVTLTWPMSELDAGGVVPKCIKDKTNTSINSVGEVNSAH
jgi:hypothetical protein